MDDTRAFDEAVPLLAAASRERLVELRRSWLDIAAETMPEDEALAGLLKDGLCDTATTAWPPPESSLLTITERAAQHAVQSGSPEAARLLSQRLRRAIYEFLLGLDAIGEAEPAHHELIGRRREVDAAVTHEEPGSRPGGRPELIWDEPEVRGVDADGTVAEPLTVTVVAADLPVAAEPPAGNTDGRTAVLPGGPATGMDAGGDRLPAWFLKMSAAGTGGTAEAVVEPDSLEPVGPGSFHQVSPEEIDPGFEEQSGPGEDPSSTVLERGAAGEEPLAVAFEHVTASEEPSSGAFEPVTASEEPFAAAFEHVITSEEPSSGAFEYVTASDKPLSGPFEHAPAGGEPSAGLFEHAAAGEEPPAEAIEGFSASEESVPGGADQVPAAEAAEPEPAPSSAAADPGAAADRPTLHLVDPAAQVGAEASAEDPSESGRVPEVFRRDQPASPLVVPSYRAWAAVLAGTEDRLPAEEVPAVPVRPTTPRGPRAEALSPRPPATGSLASRLRNARSGAPGDHPVTGADGHPGPASPPGSGPAFPMAPPPPPETAVAWLAEADPSMLPLPPVPSPVRRADTAAGAAAMGWPADHPRPAPRPAAPVAPSGETAGGGDANSPDPDDRRHWSVRGSPRQQLLRERMAQRRRDEIVRAATTDFDQHAMRPRSVARSQRHGRVELDRQRLPEEVNALLRRRHGAEAAALVQRAAQELSGHDVAELALDCGDRCRADNQSRAAVNSYLAAWRADPLYETPLWRLAETCLADGETELAVGYLERIADLMRSRSDDDAAVGVYRKILTVAPGRADLRALLQKVQSTGHFPD